MKRFFSSCGKAISYCLMFLGCQTLVPLVYQLIWIVTDPEFFSNPTQAVLGSEHILTEQVTLILLLTDLAAIGIYCLTAAIRKRPLRDHVSLYPISRRCILPILLLGICSNAAVGTLLNLIPFPDSWWDTYEASSSVLPTQVSVLAVLTTAVVGPIAEEFCFRGLLYTRLSQGMPAVLAAVFGAFVFGLVHGTALWFCYAFLLGLFMTWLFHRFGSLWASILFHMSFNGANYLLSFVPDSYALPFIILSFLGTVGCTIWLLVFSRNRNTD